MCEWMLNNGFERATLGKFQEYSIDGTDLLDLDDDDLIALEIPPGERERLLKMISRLNFPRASRFMKRPLSRSSRLSLAAWALKGADNTRNSRVISEDDNVNASFSSSSNALRASRNVSSEDQPARNSLDSFYDSLFRSPDPSEPDDVPDMQANPSKARVTGAFATASDTNLLKPTSTQQHPLRNQTHNKSDPSLAKLQGQGLSNDRKRHGYCCPDPPSILAPDDENKENEGLSPNTARLSKALKRTKSMLMPQSRPSSPSRESSRSAKLRSSGNKGRFDLRSLYNQVWRWGISDFSSSCFLAVMESSKHNLRQAKSNIIDGRKSRSSPTRDPGRRMSTSTNSTAPPPPSRGKTFMRTIYNGSSTGTSNILNSMKRFSFGSKTPSRPETADSSPKAKRFSVFSNHRFSRAMALFKVRSPTGRGGKDASFERPKSHTGAKSSNSLLSQKEKASLRRGNSDTSHLKSKLHNLNHSTSQLFSHHDRTSPSHQEPPRPKTATGVSHGKKSSHSTRSDSRSPDRSKEGLRNYSGVMKMRRTDIKRGDHWEQYFFILENNRLMTYRDEQSRKRNDDPLVAIGVKGYSVSLKEEDPNANNPPRNKKSHSIDDREKEGYRFVLAPKGDDGIMSFEFCVKTAQERIAWIRRFAMASNER